MSRIWTPDGDIPERQFLAPSPQAEVRGISWNNVLLNDDSYGVKWKTAADIQITPEKALASTVVLGCCRILAETIASFDLNLNERMPDGSESIALASPLHKIISRKPNDWQTQMEWVEQMVMHVALWGNSYTEIIPGEYGFVTKLNNLHPSRMEVERLPNGRLRYRYTNPQTGKEDKYLQEQIMHVRWTANAEGIKGMVPIEVSRDAIALARVLEIHAAKFWANSARPGVVLQMDGTLTPEAAERIRDNWERLHKGVERTARTAILTGGLKVQEVGFTNESSQYNDTRGFQTSEICRVYRIPLHLIQGESAAGDSEDKGQDFLTYTLSPWLRRIEQAISRSLIIDDDRYVASFDAKKLLLRANSTKRAQYYSTMTGLGIYSINDCRRMENLPPIANGDKHFVAMNQQTLEDAVKPKPDPSQMPGAPGAPPPAQGGVGSQPEVKKLAAPAQAEQGQGSQPKYEEAEEQTYEEAEEQQYEDAYEHRRSATGAQEEFTPVTGDNASHITIPSDDVLREALDSAKIAKVGGHRVLPPGTKVALRIDIPAFERHRVYAVTVHKWTGGKTVGSPIGYDSVVRLKGNVEFVSNENVAEKINSREQTKSPIATVKGKISSDRSIPGDINQWIAVGYNPKKAAYFYDKKTGREVVSGTDSVSVGNSVFVRKAKFGERNVAKQYRSFGAWGIEQRAFCPTGPGGGVDPTCGAGEGGGRQVDVAKIVKKIAENPWGFTLDRHNAEQPADGIMVSEFANDSKQAIQIKADSILSDETAEKLEKWLDDNEESFKGRDDRYVGGWLSKGQYYLDVATRFPPDKAQEALGAGRKASQLAVFNLGTFKQTFVKFDDGDPKKPKNWDKSFQAARVSEMATQIYDPDAPALQDHSYDKELKDHGWTSVRSLAVEALVSRGYTVEDAERLVPPATSNEEVRDAGRGEGPSAGGHPCGGEREGGVPGVSEVRGVAGGGAGEDPGAGLVPQGSREHAGLAPGRAEVRELLRRSLVVAGHDDSVVERLTEVFDLATEDRAFCPTGEGHGVDNSCSSKDGGASPGIVISDPLKFRADIIRQKSPEDRGAFVHDKLSSAGYGDSVSSPMAKMVEIDRSLIHPVALASYMLISASAIGDAPTKAGIIATSADELAGELNEPAEIFRHSAGVYCTQRDQVYVVPEGVESIFNSNKGWLSTQHPAHAVYHELAHELHFGNIRADAGIPRGEVTLDEYLSKLQPAERHHTNNGIRFMNSVDASAFNASIRAVSGYAATHPVEAVAEYYAKVRLTGERDKLLDEFMKAIGFPMKELTAAARLGKKVKK